MTNQIEPYSMIQKTNIKEHNDMINKINEIVDVVNNTNLDTINAEISGLKAKATATDTEIANIKDKDTTQDTEINGITKSLVSNVTATFDNPSRELKISLGREATPSIDATVVIPASSETGQYSEGNGIKIQNYQISVDTEVVALKSDIPVVPDISQLNADVEQAKTDIQTINTEITGITNDITNVNNKNTEQDTAIAGKVAISQGVENAGKVLGIGSDGNVTPVNAGGSSGGGEVWEEVDFNNFPTDWVNGDRIKISTSLRFSVNDPINSWTQTFNTINSYNWITYGFNNDNCSNITEFVIGTNAEYPLEVPISNQFYADRATAITISFNPLSNWQTASGSVNIMNLKAVTFNGSSSVVVEQPINKNNLKSDTRYINKMWRLKKA